MNWGSCLYPLDDLPNMMIPSWYRDLDFTNCKRAIQRNVNK